MSIYRYYKNRLESFTKWWWPYSSPNPHELAIAGLYYCPSQNFPDKVVCWSCKIDLYNWEAYHNPTQQHLRVAEDWCVWARQARTRSFVWARIDRRDSGDSSTENEDEDEDGSNQQYTTGGSWTSVRSSPRELSQSGSPEADSKQSLDSQNPIEEVEKPATEPAQNNRERASNNTIHDAAAVTTAPATAANPTLDPASLRNSLPRESSSTPHNAPTEDPIATTNAGPSSSLIPELLPNTSTMTVADTTSTNIPRLPSMETLSTALYENSWTDARSSSLPLSLRRKDNLPSPTHTNRPERASSTVTMTVPMGRTGKVAPLRRSHPHLFHPYVVPTRAPTGRTRPTSAFERPAF